jgi:hypothetical protein
MCECLLNSCVGKLPRPANAWENAKVRVRKTPPDVQTYTLRLVMLANNTDDGLENKTKFVAIRISHTDLCGAVKKFMSFLLAEGSGPLAQARRKAAFMRLQISEPIALRVSAVLEAASLFSAARRRR